jgi:hypothetical protein
VNFLRFDIVDILPADAPRAHDPWMSTSRGEPQRGQQ